MKHLFQFLPVFLAMFFAVPSFGQFQDRTATSPVADDDYVTDMTRTARVGIGFATNTAFNAALGTANRARLALRDGIIAHHVSDTIGNFAGKWLGLGIGNPGGPVQPYGLAIADTGSVAFFNVLRENFNGVIRKNTVAGFGAEGINANRFIILHCLCTTSQAGRCAASTSLTARAKHESSRILLMTSERSNVSRSMG